jgi:hypothetical protein
MHVGPKPTSRAGNPARRPRLRIPKVAVSKRKISAITPKVSLCSEHGGPSQRDFPLIFAARIPDKTFAGFRVCAAALLAARWGDP